MSQNTTNAKANKTHLLNRLVMPSISDIRWEYEDSLPKEILPHYEAIFDASRVIYGVRMFPYIKDVDGNKIWISKL